MRASMVDPVMAEHSSASWATGVLWNGCIIKGAPPPFDLPYTSFVYIQKLSCANLFSWGHRPWLEETAALP
jgi:hypothetical protein